jgi:hypothetical protein
MGVVDKPQDTKISVTFVFLKFNSYTPHVYFNLHIADFKPQ